MKAYLSRRYRLSASHRLHTASYSIERNREVYGKCNHPFGHGHNYVVEVMVSGPVDPATGMVCDLAQLDSLVQREVIDRFDHSNLNLQPAFAAVVPTTENFCIEVYRALNAGLASGKLEKVRVEETGKNFFEYVGTSVKERSL
jgi:6-pyruvoyltetrahydropterin/6-carboxytetrahydropterin synthase